MRKAGIRSLPKKKDLTQRITRDTRWELSSR